MSIMMRHSAAIMLSLPFAICVMIYIGSVLVPAGDTSMVSVLSLSENINPMNTAIMSDCLLRGSMISLSICYHDAPVSCAASMKV